MSLWHDVSMYRGSRPRILPIIVVIIVVALIVATLVTAGRMLFSGSSSQGNKKVTTASSIESALLNESTDRSVQWTVRGPIVSNENFRSYQINISPVSRTYVIYSGYLDQVMNTKTYDNNTQAYEQFVYALDKTGIPITHNVPDTDLRGVCATQGLAYKFDTLSSSTIDHTMWTSTCKDSPGTMTASPLQVQALFVNQIPDFHPLFGTIY